MHCLLQSQNGRGHWLFPSQQDLTHTEEFRHRRSSSGMVLVIVRQNQPIHRIHAIVSQIRNNHSLADVKCVLRTQGASRIHQDGLTMRRDHECRISLPYIDEMDLQRSGAQ